MGWESKPVPTAAPNPQDNPVKPQPAVARVTRRFAAPLERVFDAWLDADQLRAWMSISERKGPQGEVLRVRIDGRVGGAFSFVVRRNGQELDHIGEYLEVERPRRLTFTWAAGPLGQVPPERSRVHIALAPRAGGCEVTLSHEMDPRWAEFVERAQGAWTLMLDAIADTLV